MLGRYKMVMFPKASDLPLPEGKRINTTAKRRMCLSPPQELVDSYLDNVSGDAWERYEKEYLKILEERFNSDRNPFDKIAEEARKKDVWLGCWCPTAKNPDVYQCHTVLALRFMKEKYPDLRVILPDPPALGGRSKRP